MSFLRRLLGRDKNPSKPTFVEEPTPSEQPLYPSPEAADEIVDVLSRVIVNANEEIHEPTFNLYRELEFEPHPEIGGSHIVSLDVDRLQVKDIELQHIMTVYSHFRALGSTIYTELKDGTMTNARWHELAKFVFLMVSTASLLNIARLRMRSPINVAAAYKAIKKVYDETLGGYFDPLSAMEETEIINKAVTEAHKMIYQHGFTVIGVPT